MVRRSMRRLEVGYTTAMHT